MAVEATTVVSFNSTSDDEDYIFSVQLDDTLNVDTNEAAAALSDEGEYASSPYLQILTDSYYPSNTKNVSGGIAVDTDTDEITVVTTFPPESDVYLIINKSSNVTIDEVRCTGGSIRKQGTVTRTGSSDNLFPEIEEPEEGEDANTYSLDVVPTDVDISYVGNRGRLSEEISSVGIATYTHNVRYAPFIAKFDYEYDCTLYKLKSPTMSLAEAETYSLGIVFYITVSEAD